MVEDDGKDDSGVDERGHNDNSAVDPEKIDFNELEEFAMCRIGLRQEQFWAMTWRQFFFAVRHYHHKREQGLDIARHIGFWSIMPYSKGKNLSPRTLLSLELDERKQAAGRAKLIPADELKRIAKERGLNRN